MGPHIFVLPWDLLIVELVLVLGLGCLFVSLPIMHVKGPLPVCGPVEVERSLVGPEEGEGSSLWLCLSRGLDRGETCGIESSMLDRIRQLGL